MEQAEKEMREKEKVCGAPARPPTPNLTKLRELVGFDVCEVYGGSGSGKSKLCLLLAREAKEAGIPFVYIDTEGNLRDADRRALEGSYQLITSITEIDKFISGIPAARLLFLDSAGYPILAHWARLKFEERMSALVKLINWFSSIKEWCAKHQALAVVTNQPESIFAQVGSGRQVPEPFGDKSIYTAKEVIFLERPLEPGRPTTIKGYLYRSRGYPFMFHLFDFVIGQEMKLNWKI